MSSRSLSGGGRRPSSLWCITVVELKGPPPLCHAQPNSRPTSQSHVQDRLPWQPIFYFGAKSMFCGVDVSQQRLDVRLEQEGPSASFDNTPDGIAQLASFCRQHRVQLVAMEASGGYEKLPFALLCSEAIPVAIVNPRAVRRFAQAMGYLEKTDALDAGIIAHFARTKNCIPSAPGSAQQQHLRALVTRLRQLTDLQTAQRNQSRLLSDTTVKTLFEQILALIKTQIRSLEKAIAELIQADPLWQRMEAYGG